MKKNAKLEKVLLSLSAVLAVGLLLLMDLWLIPRIEQHTGGLHVFDLNTLGYSFETAKAFVSRLQPEDRALYLTKQFPLDFLCPLCYGCFFALSLKRLHCKKALYIALPLGVAMLDYAENLCALRMLTTDFSKVTATVGSTCTVVKSAGMVVLFVLLVVKCVKKRNK